VASPTLVIGERNHPGPARDTAAWPERWRSRWTLLLSGLVHLAVAGLVFFAARPTLPEPPPEIVAELIVGQENARGPAWIPPPPLVEAAIAEAPPAPAAESTPGISAPIVETAESVTAVASVPLDASQNAPPAAVSADAPPEAASLAGLPNEAGIADAPAAALAVSLVAPATISVAPHAAPSIALAAEAAVPVSLIAAPSPVQSAPPPALVAEVTEAVSPLVAPAPAQALPAPIGPSEKSASQSPPATVAIAALPGAPAIAAVAPPPAAPSMALDLRAEVGRALEGLPCARVSARVNTDAVILAGHVASDADRLRLRTRLAGLPGVERLDESGLTVVGEPHCGLLAFLGRGDIARSAEQRFDAAAIGAPAQAAVRRLAGGTVLQLDLGAPDYPAYIHVSYFSGDGSVAHLLPVSGSDHRTRPGESLKLGGAGGRGRRATIGPPYGLDVVLAVASAEPLFATPRPVVERASDYLAALAAALEARRSGGRVTMLEYAYYLLLTEPPR
jgi:hypothetical protein